MMGSEHYFKKNLTLSIYHFIWQKPPAMHLLQQAAQTPLVYIVLEPWCLEEMTQMWHLLLQC